MDNIATYLNIHYQGKKTPPHEQAAKVDEIIKLVGLSEKYPYQYWLRKVKSFTFGDILDICKTAEGLPDKYPKGAFITNRLCRKNLKK